MRTRPGFARLLPLMTLTGLAAGTIALMARPRPVQAPEPGYRRVTVPFPVRHGGGYSDVVHHVPAQVIVDAHGRKWDLEDIIALRGVRFCPALGIGDSEGQHWDLADIPGHTIRGLDAHQVEWSDADLHGVRLLECDFRGADLRGASLRNTELWRCDFTSTDLGGADLRGASLRNARLWSCNFTGADLSDADLSAVTFDRFTRWPAGFDPQAHGARVVR